MKKCIKIQPNEKRDSGKRALLSKRNVTVYLKSKTVEWFSETRTKIRFRNKL